jgi:hypothetical protein
MRVRSRLRALILFFRAAEQKNLDAIEICCKKMFFLSVVALIDYFDKFETNNSGLMESSLSVDFITSN